MNILHNDSDNSLFVLLIQVNSVNSTGNPSDSSFLRETQIFILQLVINSLIYFHRIEEISQKSVLFHLGRYFPIKLEKIEKNRCNR